jgi:glutamate N-acetyltransferase/amino-acid N-acetyltransferase
MQGKTVQGGVCAPQGFEAAGAACGIKESGDHDLCILASRQRCAAAGVFTRNAFRAAPVLVTERCLAEDGRLRAVVANSGNANAWTGNRGLKDAEAMAKLTARELGADGLDVAVASTGVIGCYLPMQRIEKGIVDAAARLDKEAHLDAARAIMTTDTHPKEVAWDYGDFIIGGMVKGSGMIRPDLATMLAFLTTDAQVEPSHLRGALRGAVERTFNLITIDGCTSTNDMVLVMANGASGRKLSAGDIEEPLYHACAHLARELVKDGEGANRFISVRVHEAAGAVEARQAAMAVADSLLVKTAVFGGDANWGRVIQALGTVFVDIDPAGVRVLIGGVGVAAAGVPVEVDEGSLRAAMEGKEVELDIFLGRGDAEVEVWTCDLSYDYVRINADYHT